MSGPTSLREPGRRYPLGVVSTLSRVITPRRFHRITLVALIFLVVIIFTGAAVRLTGSGLGCTDWPKCTDEQFVAPLEFNPMVEFVNRLITGLVAIPVIAAMIGSLVQRPRRRDLIWLSFSLVVGVAVQAIVGAFVVWAHLAPPFVITHFLLSILTIWAAMVLYRRSGRPEGSTVAIVDRRGVNLARAMFVAVWLVLVTGTVVTGAGPHGGDENAERIAMDLGDVARIHGAFVIVFLALTLATLWWLHRRGAPEQVDQHGRALVVVILAQAGIGYAQYFGGVPAYLVMFHIIGSVAVFLTTLWFYLGLFTVPSSERVDAPREVTTV